MDMEIFDMKVLRNVLVPVASVTGSTFLLYDSVFSSRTEGFIPFEMIMGIGLLFVFLSFTDFVKKHESVWAFCFTIVATSAVNIRVSYAFANFLIDNVLAKIGVIYVSCIMLLSIEEILVLAVIRLIWLKQNDKGFQKMHLRDVRRRERMLERLYEKIEYIDRKYDGYSYRVNHDRGPDVEELEKYFENWRNTKCS